MSKWASSVISPTSSSGTPSAEHAGPRDRIVAADEQRQRMRLGARCDRIADRAGVACSMRQAGELDVAAVADWRDSSRPVSTS